METEEWEETEPKFVPSETEHDQLRPLILSVRYFFFFVNFIIDFNLKIRMDR